MKDAEPLPVKGWYIENKVTVPNWKEGPFKTRDEARKMLKIFGPIQEAGNKIVKY